MLQPSFFLHCAPFADPNSVSPGLGGYGRELFFHFKAVRFQEKREREVDPFFPAAAAICCLNFNLSVGAISTACHLHVLAATIPARNDFLTPTSMQLFWKALFFFVSENLTLHFFILAFFFGSQPLDSRSHVHSKRFHTACHHHSFYFAASTQLVLQEATRNNHLTSMTDKLGPLFSTSFLNLFITFFCHVCHFLISFPSRVP